ncbi:hypothetical protein [Cyclobacterium salsum]|uniref:hypothetical protein n=1 Tax=Cyclobacterium salsum TaxID=2666329 RepID=UPI0013917AD6|nr:hypothetical protein [Cyclobacterium salsum]
MSESEQIFYDKSQIYWKWILKIYSRKLGTPVHIIWMTDKTDDCIDKMVLTKTNQIVGAFDHTLLFQYLKNHKIEIPDPVNTFTWLNEVEGLTTISITKYDVGHIERSLDIGEFTKASVYQCVDFINLFTDYANQVDENSLYDLRYSRQVVDLWNFGNFEIFWKEWGQEELPAVKIPPLRTNFKLLKNRMNAMIDTFLERIEILDQNKKIPQKSRIHKVLKVSRTKGHGIKY